MKGAVRHRHFSLENAFDDATHLRLSPNDGFRYLLPDLANRLQCALEDIEGFVHLLISDDERHQQADYVAI